MIPPWRSSIPAYDHTPLPTPEDGALGLCTVPGCTHITEGADDPTLPMPAKLWPSARCMASWLRDREREATADRDLVDEHRADCNQHGPRTVGGDAAWSWLPDPKQRPGVSELTWRGDRAS